ncbi:MAG: hypothetical protein Q7V88_08880 [Actinomycetota bacterium]|nr:hypothetical protein [Actinomycetota bacterium]
MLVGPVLVVRVLPRIAGRGRRAVRASADAIPAKTPVSIARLVVPVQKAVSSVARAPMVASVVAVSSVARAPMVAGPIVVAGPTAAIGRSRVAPGPEATGRTVWRRAASPSH